MYRHDLPQLKTLGLLFKTQKIPTQYQLQLATLIYILKGLLLDFYAYKREIFLWQVKQKRYFNMSYGFQSKQKRSVNLDNKEHAIRT